MLITKTPLRITLGGGGTDLPEFSSKHGGYWLNTTIDKYIYVAVSQRFEKQLRIAYSQLELVDDPADIKHPMIKALYDHFSIQQHLDMSTMSDLPAGTGLGSSGAFAVGLINALSHHRHESLLNMEMAKLAYTIEREVLKQSVGPQDQYSAAYGGPRAYKMKRNGEITQYPITQIYDLEDKLMLIYTSRTRNSNTILEKVKTSEEQLKKIKAIGEISLRAILNDDWELYGALMHDHWTIKKTITPDMSTSPIEKLYSKCLSLGAYGGKLVGAGGGGFLLLVVPSDEVKTAIRRTVFFQGFVPVEFKFSHNGTEIIQ